MRAVLTETQKASSPSREGSTSLMLSRQVERDVGVQFAAVGQPEAAVHDVPVAAALGAVKGPLQFHAHGQSVQRYSVIGFQGFHVNFDCRARSRKRFTGVVQYE